MRIAFSLALLAGAVACGDDAPIADAGPPDARPPGGTISLTWSLSDGANPIDCADVGGVNVRLTATPIDGGTATVESLSCTSGTATTNDIAPGTYDVQLDLRASGNRTLLAAPIEVEDVEVVVGQDASIGAQTFTVTPTGTFQLTIAAQGVANNCTAGQIVEVELALADGTGACVPVLFQVGAAAYQTDCGNPQPFAGGCIENNQLITSTAPSGARTLSIIGRKAGPIDCWLGSSAFTVLGNNLDTDLESEGLTLQTATVGCP